MIQNIGYSNGIPVSIGILGNVFWIFLILFFLRNKFNGLALRAKSYMLVLKEKPVINQEGPVFVKLVGRKRGLLAWLLTQIGIDHTVTLTVYERRIELAEDRLSGHVTHIYPLTALASFGSAYLRPIIYLVLAVLCLILGLVAFGIIFRDYAGFAFMLFVVFVAISVVFGFLYYLNKCMCLYTVSNSGAGPRIFLKRSVIEGQGLNELDTLKIVTILTTLIEQNQKHA